MNMNQIINMIVRMVLRKVINGGVNAGINAFAKKDTAGCATPQEERGSQTPQLDVKQTRRAARMARRMTKF